MKKIVTLLALLVGYGSNAQNFWVTINNPNLNASTPSMIVAQNGNIVVSDNGSNNRNEYSTNQGSSWTYCTGNAFHSKKFIKVSNGDIYASGDNFVKSTNNGVSYTVLGPLGINLSDFVINSSGVMFAVSANVDGMILRSVNSGVTWDTVNSSLSSSTASHPTCIAINAANELFIGTTGFGTAGAQIFKSTDNGATFTPVSGNTFGSSSIKKILIDNTGLIYV